MIKNTLNFLRDESGVEVAEYAVAAALIVAIAVVVYQALGDAINQSNTDTGEKIKDIDEFTPTAST